MNELSPKAKQLALSLWQEQLDHGLGVPDEVASEDQLDEWLLNRVYGVDVLERAAAGDVAAIVQVRTEAGLPLFS